MTNDLSSLCPICGEGHLQPRIGRSPVEYKGQTSEVEFHSSVCDACESEQLDAAQLRANKRAMVAFKKQVDGLLSGAEVRALREKLGLSQADAAKVFGGGPVAFSKYESDDVAQSEAMDKLLRLAAEIPAAFEVLTHRVDDGSVATSMEWEEVRGWSVEISSESSTKRPQLRVVSSSTSVGEPHWSNAA
ncbi:MAG TPA: type II toxin-antitoxin system MqsA family antitoxin [Gammaproteobacteria bacterium]|nr:type II toxin-antitoxin system MqsA family antitoxin [Gammaproteobacteria bacterium]